MSGQCPTSRSERPGPSALPGVVSSLRDAGCVFAEDEARLLIESAGTPADLAALVDRRVAGVPLEQLLGWAEFCGLHIAVDPAVFVPRRRTEFLVRRAAALLREREAGADPAGRTAIVLDMCCGSAAVGTALATMLDPVEVHAVDIDPAAVRCARRNLATAAGEVYEGDLYEPLPARLRGGVDLLLANAPYVPTEEIALMPPEARLHEPMVALDGGPDGLDVQRRVIAQAPAWLAPGGFLLVETSDLQAAHTVDAVARCGLVPELAWSPESDATVVVGAHPSGRRYMS